MGKPGNNIVLQQYQARPCATEAKIQEAIISFLRTREWFVRATHGNTYQTGFPDLFASHVKYGGRWIEVKNPEKYSFTAAQLEIFPQMCAHGAPVWVLVAASQSEYDKLFRPCNWHQYLMRL